jgi:hypothetical protein
MTEAQETIRDNWIINIFGKSHQEVRLFGEKVRVISGCILIKIIRDEHTGEEFDYYVSSSADFRTTPSDVQEMLTRFKQWKLDRIFSDKDFIERYLIPAIENGFLPSELNPFESTNGYLVLKRDVNTRFKEGDSFSKSNTSDIAMIMTAVGLRVGLVQDY